MTAVLPKSGIFYQSGDNQHHIDLGERYADLNGNLEARSYTEACFMEPLEPAPVQLFIKQLHRTYRRQGISFWYFVTITYRHADTDTTWLSIRHGSDWTASQLQTAWQAVQMKLATAS